jgi:hypothetical protein
MEAQHGTMEELAVLAAGDPLSDTGFPAAHPDSSWGDMYVCARSVQHSNGIMAEAPKDVAVLLSTHWGALFPAAN